MKTKYCFFQAILRNRMAGFTVFFVATMFSTFLMGCPMDVKEAGKNIENAISLSTDTWTNGEIASTNDEQWFKFHLTANPQCVHINYGTLTNVYIELYDKNKSKTGNGLNLYGSNGGKSSFHVWFGGLSSTDVGDIVYLKVTAFSGTGTYRIAFNKTSYSPGEIITTLPSNTWASGNISGPSSEQWFKFSPTSSDTYIHVKFDSLTDLNIRLYTIDDSFGDSINLFGNSGDNKYERRSLSSGSVYYIRVTPNSSSGPGSGIYQIAFNTSSTPPN